jgi:23S rRNA pseudouridine2604 synthase
MPQSRQNGNARRVHSATQKPTAQKQIDPSAPVRINKYLADRGISTRREADNLIASGKIMINGKRAVLGDKVSKTDNVDIVGMAKKTYTYYAYYKPRGVITHSPQKGETDIAASVQLKGVAPLGRLDKDSEGLMILTDDGRITDRLLNPKYTHEKEYTVKVRVPVKDFQLNAINKGMQLEGMKTKPAKTKRLGEKSFAITLIEGQKHEIRRICDALTLPIDSLKRVRIMNVQLGKLAPNEYRKIEGIELKDFLSSLALK